MMAAFLASAVLTGAASGQVAVELVPSVVDAEAPIMLTLTASTPLDEPILGYEWRGLGVAPSCRSRDCTIDLPVASCRRVEVSVTDRFGEITTIEDQVCARENGASPPRARIEVGGADPIVVAAETERGDAALVLTRMWIDDREVDLIAEIPEDGECHVVELIAADAEGRIGLDQRFVCNDDDAPRIALGADPTFCPRPGETLRICAEVIDPLQRGVDPIGGEPVPLDDCAGMIASPAVDRIVVRGETKQGVTHGSIISCTAPAFGRPNLLFAGLPEQVIVVRGESRSAVLNIYGGEPPYVLDGRLEGSSTIGISRTVDTPMVAVELDVPGRGSWNLLSLLVTDARGLQAVTTASVTTNDPVQMMSPQALDTVACSSIPPELSGLWILVGLILIWRRR